MIEINSEEEKKKITIKEIYQNINNAVTGDVLANLAYSSMIMIYFMFFNIQYEVLPEVTLTKYINISSIAFLIISILMIEISYKKEKDNILLYGVEFFATDTCVQEWRFSLAYDTYFRRLCLQIKR